jgi:AraC-like DNA-binding protein
LNWRFSFFDVLLLIGITQGFFITMQIWRHWSNSQSKLLLSFMLTVFNLLCIKILIHTTGLWQTTFFRYFPLPFDLAIQPLIWLYIASLTKPHFRFTRDQLWHFVPFALSLAYSVFIYLSVWRVPDLLAKDMVANHYQFNAIKEGEDLLSVLSGCLYWWLGLRLVLQYRHWLNQNIAATNYPTYAWLRNVAVWLGILILGLAVAVALEYFVYTGFRPFYYWQVFFVYLAVLIYYIGFRGYQLPEQQMAGAAQQIIESPPDIVPVKETKLSPEAEQSLKAAILTALEKDKCYLDPELSLQKLAQHIAANPALVSTVINTHWQKSFRTLINDYRLEEAKQRLKDPRFSQLSILGIAYECGFNSEASFYRIFKAGTGISPKEYIRRQSSPE